MFAEPGGAGGPGALAPKDFLFGWRRRRLGRVRELRSGFDLLHAGLLANDIFGLPAALVGCLSQGSTDGEAKMFFAC